MEEVRRIRKERGLTQDQLAELANVDRPSLSLIETGRRSPSIETLQKLADALGVEVADFFPRAQPDLFAGAADELTPPLTLPAMWRATPGQRRRALGAASDAEVSRYRQTIDRFIDSVERFEGEERDKATQAAQVAYLQALRAETDSFDVEPPTPEQRDELVFQAGLG